MPDVGTPQATWRDDPEVTARLDLPQPSLRAVRVADMEAAVAADRRIQTATLRAKIEALPLSAFEPTSPAQTMYIDGRMAEGVYGRRGDTPADFRRRVLAVLDDVLGGDGA